MELGSNEAIKQTVASRLGVSILSHSTVRAELEAGELVQLHVRGLPIQRNWYLVHLKDKRLSPVAEAFRDFLLADQSQSKGSE